MLGTIPPAISEAASRAGAAIGSELAAVRAEMDRVATPRRHTRATSRVGRSAGHCGVRLPFRTGTWSRPLPTRLLLSFCVLLLRTPACAASTVTADIMKADSLDLGSGVGDEQRASGFDVSRCSVCGDAPIAQGEEMDLRDRSPGGRVGVPG